MKGEKNENERDEPAEDDLGTTLDMVRRATLDLLDALPVRPERLRVSAADVTLHLDWRTPAVAAAGPAPLTAAYALAPAATAGAHANGSPAPLVVQEPP